MRIFVIFILFLIVSINLKAIDANTFSKEDKWLNHYDNIVQDEDSLQILDGYESDGETIPHKTLEQVNVFPKKNFKSKHAEKRYWRLIYKVKKVYPYAKEAGALVRKYRETYPGLEREHDSRVYIRMAEKEILRKYSKELKKLSISEGAILIKLIDREINKTSYELIEEFKGNVSAFFWQGIARLFGNNLKTHYDPDGEDKQIEEIIRYIEMGII